MTEQLLLEIAKDACAAATAAGAEFAEVRVSEGRSASVRLERSAVDSTEVRLSSGASIRAFVKGGLGQVSLDGLDRDRIIQGGRQAAEMARFAVSDKDFVTLPGADGSEEVPGLYDPAVEALGVSELSRIALEAVDAALSIAPDSVCTGAASAGGGRSAIANSLGVARISRGTQVSAWIEPIIKKDGDAGAFYDFDSARTMAQFDHRAMAVSAAEMSRKFLGARKIDSAVMPVVLGPLCSSSLLDSLAGFAEAESHQRGRSWLCGKVGQKIGSDLLTIRDDGTIPGGLGSRSYDSEGVSTRPIMIIEGGVLTNLLHNSYTANKAGASYTGHAHGGGIGPTNVIPNLGQVSAAEIIRDTGRGLYINMGGLSPDGATGEVSATVDFGFLIENGEIAYPVSSTMIGINGFELLSNIDAISSDARLEPGSVMPTIRIQGVRVAGGK